MKNNNIENNKLIAKFMGVYSEENGYDYTKIGNLGAMYDKSWDWLMPVIEKIQDLFVDNPELDYQLYDDIRFSVPYLDDTYNAVVEFIKNQETL